MFYSHYLACIVTPDIYCHFLLLTLPQLNSTLNTVSSFSVNYQTIIHAIPPEQPPNAHIDSCSLLHPLPPIDPLSWRFLPATALEDTTFEPYPPLLLSLRCTSWQLVGLPPPLTLCRKTPALGIRIWSELPRYHSLSTHYKSLSDAVAWLLVDIFHTYPRPRV